ncbi:MAG: MBL fold metallo-hydrolase [Flavobacteriales bacterium]
MTTGIKRTLVLALCWGMVGIPAVSQTGSQVELVVLGNVQDGGSPHIGCGRPCCRNLFLRPRSERRVVSLGLIHRGLGASVMFEATPDFPSQWASLNAQSLASQPSVIFLTHAHMGHYSGLMHLGREALGAQGVRVAAMPRMAEFLKTNGPWSQLVELGNIELVPLEDNRPLPVLEEAVQVTPLRVPHRDEFSETVGYRVDGPKRSALFIPDIDKWTLWERSLVEELSRVDYAFVDATFYDSAEVNHRDMSEIPHPFVVETMDALSHLSPEDRSKIHFIHMNHTNPLLDPNSGASQFVEAQGFHVAREGMSFGL